jgi:hypothetical protein
VAVVVDFVASVPGVVLVVATVVDLVSSAAAIRATIINVATSNAASIFFIITSFSRYLKSHLFTYELSMLKVDFINPKS